MAEFDYQARCKQLENNLKAVQTLFYDSDLEKVNQLALDDVQRSELRQGIHDVIRKWTKEDTM